MTEIINAYLGLNALRQAGYRSTATAVAELVDNSIEAKASRIDIVALSRGVVVNKRTSNQVEKIAVLDNGDGMSKETLSQCLSLGWGTRLEQRKGLGRFGFGLKGSSISQARRVEVYSWLEDGDVYRVHLDLEEIKDEKLQELKSPVKVSLPEYVLEGFSDQIGSSGTLVVWEELDQMDLKKPNTLISRINRDLCRIYRHFLDDDDDYGDKIDVWLHVLKEKESKCEKSIQLVSNDPLYVMTPNNLPGYESESTNIFHGEPFKVKVNYFNGQKHVPHDIEFRFTLAKPSIQLLGGNSPQGKHYARNTGISFVRAGREIDFGAFGFIDRSEPRHRWWGAEIRFDPVLDELFGVTNNKQEVRAIAKLDPEELEQLKEDAENEDHRAEFLLTINNILSEHISDMMRVIKGRREGSQKKKSVRKGIASAVNVDVSTDSSPTESADHGENLTTEQKVQERAKILLVDDETLTEEEAEQFARETLDYRVDIQTGDWPGELFLDRRPVANASVGIINRNTRFYEEFWRHLEDAEDQKGFEALEIIVMALVRSEDELVKEFDRAAFERFRQRWGSWVERLIRHAGA